MAGEQVGEAADGVVEVRGAIAEVGSEGDGYSIHRVGSTDPIRGPT
jgi:hypothetical protein